MTVLTNSAAGGTNGVAVTTGNSGGASGNAFNTATVSGAGTALVFDNTHSTMAYKYTTGTAGASYGYLQWSSVTGYDVSGSVDVYLTANPLADTTLFNLAWSNGVTTTNVYVQVTTTGKLVLFDTNPAGNRFTTTASVPLNTWFKVTFAFHTMNDPSGSYDVRLYPDLVTGTPTETHAATTTWTSYGGAFSLIWGSCNAWKDGFGAVIGSGSYWLGNLAVTYVPTPVSASSADTITLTDTEYLRPIPAISSVSPAWSSTAGGDFISIIGYGLDDTTDVIVAGVSQTFTVFDENLITFYSQSQAPGLYDVTIHNPYGDYTLDDSFQFITPEAIPVPITGMRLPFTLPAGLPGAQVDTSGGLYVPSGPRYNHAVGGLPFLSAASPDNPIVRETVPIRKEQMDTSSTPGEQALGGWWLRSQPSFHGGAGQDYADPQGGGQDTTSLTRFKASRNVDVWTPGKVKLLNTVEAHPELAGAVDITEVVYGDGYPGVVAVNSNGTYTRVWGLGVTKHATNTLSGSFELQTVTSDGSYLYAADGSSVWSAPIPYHRSDNMVWTKTYTISTGAPVHLGYAKQRLMLGSGPNIYELIPHPVSPPVAVASPKFTASDPNWRWVNFTESGSAIYAVGNNGARGSIVKFVLAADGSIPVLSGAAVAAQLPPGEVPYSALGYLGAYVGIGTSKGVRVAIAGDNGDLSYGPLLFTTTEPVRCWTARDRFLFCAVTGAIDGQSGVCRIDLSNQVSDMRFAYATDLTATGDGSTCRVVANLGGTDKIVYGTDTALYLEDDRALAPSGYLLTSRVRFGTLEPKLYKRLKVRGPALVGGLLFQILDEGDHPAGTYTYRLGRSPGEIEAAITSPSTPQDFVSVKFTLTRGNTGGGGEFWGYQLMALPGAQRQRMIQLPLWCFDWERDGKGQRRGAAGSAFQRLSELEALEKAGSAVVYQDLDNRTNANCVIEQVSFKQTSPPATMDGVGGVITLTMRTV